MAGHATYLALLTMVNSIFHVRSFYFLLKKTNKNKNKNSIANLKVKHEIDFGAVL